MALDDLTAQERLLLDDYSRQRRKAAQHCARLLNMLQRLEATHTATAGSLVSQMDSEDVLDDGNGLADATPLTKGQLNSLITSDDALIVALDTLTLNNNRIKAAGSNNVAGEPN